jgi:fructose-bisphosphate aldolase class 1
MAIIFTVYACNSSATVDESLDKFISHAKAGEVTEVDVMSGAYGDTLTYKLKDDADTTYTAMMKAGDTVRGILVDAGIKPGDANYPDVKIKVAPDSLH